MSRRPVIFVTLDEEEDYKVRLITISKAQLLSEVEARTYKYVDITPAGGANRQGAAISADAENRVDSAILLRNLEYRDAEIRTLISHSLVSGTTTAVDNLLDGTERNFVYFLRVPTEFSDGDVESVKTFIHRYLIAGTLYDWYADTGQEIAGKYAADLTRIEAAIDNILRRPSVEKKPMQPFGPAKFPL